MFYVPPECDVIDFSFSGSYFVPPCDMLDFSFGLEGDIEIRSSSSQVIIRSDAFELFTGAMIRPANANIRVSSGDSKVEVLIPVSIDSSQIRIRRDSTTIQVLPDMVIKNAEINIEFEKSVVRTPRIFDLPTGTSPQMRGSWDENKTSDSVKKMPWGVAEEIKHDVDCPLLIPDKIDPDIRGSAASLHWVDNRIAKMYDDYHFHQDDQRKSSWIGRMDWIDYLRKKTWGSSAVYSDKTVYHPYLEPGAKDVHKRNMWDIPDAYDWNQRLVSLEPGGNDAHATAAWGPFSYFTLCGNLPYNEPDGCDIRFAFPNKYQLEVGVCEEIRFEINNYSSDVRCPYQHWHAGKRDNGSGIIIRPELSYPARKKVYYMLNTVLVEEVITKQPIEVLHVDAKIDRNSWLWSFSVTVADKCYLDLIKPINGVMGHIKINMNGYVWYCTVEGWSENRSFGSQAWTITGRSPSMMFGDPISQKQSGVIVDAKQGQTVFEEIVNQKQLPTNWPSQFSNWAADFSIYHQSGKVYTGFNPSANWYLPGNTVSYTEKTEIDILKDLAGSIGAYVQTEPDENRLTVKPLYAHQPWNWSVDNADIEWITMTESQIVEIGRSNELNPYYQAVYVLGESIGGSNDGSSSDPSNTAIAVDVRRDDYGSSTAAYAPMITNPYITSTKAALEKGRMALAQTGEWVKHTIRIGTLCMDSSSFGLFKTGDMISVYERGYPWYGQVTGVTIAAVSSGAGFAVEQAIEVEEYIEVNNG